MPREYRLFLASPGAVATERAALPGVVDEINQVHGAQLDYRLRLVRWETDVAPGGGRAQEVINQQIGDYDVFVGIMWRRMGTPTSVAESATAEEFELAYRAWKARPEMPLMFYFCQAPFMPRVVEEVEQMRKVLLFREQLKGKALLWDYEARAVFTDQIRKHLCLRLARLVKDEKEAPGNRVKPDPGRSMTCVLSGHT